MDEDDFSDLIEILSTESVIKPMEEVHISLIRGHYTLRHHQIPLFLAEVDKMISILDPFTVCLDSIEVYDNEESSRSFICLCQSENTKEFEKLRCERFVQSFKSIFAEFGARVRQENQTDDFNFHSSLAWCLPVNKKIAQNMVKKLEVSDSF